MRIAVLFMSYGPYHLARVKALAALGGQRHQVLGIEVARREAAYAWERPAGAANFPLITLFPEAGLAEDIPAWRQVIALWRCLQQQSPDALAICGYRNPIMAAALLWSRWRGKVAVFMSESKKDDFHRARLKERVKSLILRGFGAALAGGLPQQAYLRELGLPADKIFTGYDVVDNQHFQVQADRVRRQAGGWRDALGLPATYFLTVCRLVPKKNLPGLLEAYRLYRQISPSEPWGLVIVGSGPQEAELRHRAAHLEGVHFPGFKQYDELPAYYGLAHSFILASSHAEQWGLVVNEAMAAGLPVLVSRACGCASDLVEEGVNGFTFDPVDTAGLAALMTRMASGSLNLAALGQASRGIIARWSPEVYAENLLRAIDAGRAGRRIC